jgi:hypothetical protein
VETGSPSNGAAGQSSCLRPTAPNTVAPVIRHVEERRVPNSSRDRRRRKDQ